MGTFLKAFPLFSANIPSDVIKILNEMHIQDCSRMFLFFEMFAFALHSLKKQVCKYHFPKRRMFTIAWLIDLVLRKERNNVTQDEKCKYMYRSLDPPLRQSNSLRNNYKIEITAI